MSIGEDIGHIDLAEEFELAVRIDYMLAVGLGIVEVVAHMKDLAVVVVEIVVVD